MVRYPPLVLLHVGVFGTQLVVVVRALHVVRALPVVGALPVVRVPSAQVLHIIDVSILRS